ncbi:MAG: bifunctional phosphoribosylaminoimidazolecarboxamide formyltransferase/IMP cyclohydrolase [PVC group bacterium]
MNNLKRTALISVSDKTGLLELGTALAGMGFEIISTGGTARALEEEGIKVKRLADYTGFPEMLDGRVKSLHPKVHGGLLARRDNPEHMAELVKAAIEPIDFLAINLYPFEDKLNNGQFDEDTLVEFIDIGGVSLLRAGAKNYRSVTVVSAPADYSAVMEEMRNGGGSVSPATRRRLAAKAFLTASRYDGMISAFLAGEKPGDFPARLELACSLKQRLRYGENRHQEAALYVQESGIRSPAPEVGSSICNARRLQGKELSYNNILDLENALSLVLELESPASVIIKHNNPCGATVGETLLESYRRARATDPLSAFGSVVAFNREIGEEVAVEVTSTFVEALLAPAFTPGALETLARKKNLRVLESGPLRRRPPHRSCRSVYGGMLVQETDLLHWDADSLKVVAGSPPSPAEWAALSFAWTVCKHTRSNAVVLGRGTATVGIGAGQMSRIDAARLAVEKARRAGLEVKGTVMASDAFFPFRDVVDLAAENGVRAIVQPGGSIRDGESVAVAREHGITMVFTGIRHFRH